LKLNERKASWESVEAKAEDVIDSGFVCAILEGNLIFLSSINKSSTTNFSIMNNNNVDRLLLDWLNKCRLPQNQLVIQINQSLARLIHKANPK